MIRLFWGGPDGNNIVRHETEIVTAEGELALTLIKSYGLIAMKPTEEINPDGSQKMIALEPEQVVTRACFVARLAYDNIRAMGWTVDVPVPDSFKGKEIDQ